MSDFISGTNQHLAAQVPLARPPAAPRQNPSPAAESAPNQSGTNAHGTKPFIDGSSIGPARYVGQKG